MRILMPPSGWAFFLGEYYSRRVLIPKLAREIVADCPAKLLRQLAVANELNSLLPQHLPRLGRGEQRQLLLARLTQPRPHLVQFGIVVAGMADELPRTLRQPLPPPAGQR